jgi:hypothetical protein
VPRLSIIIPLAGPPTPNHTAAELETTLLSVLENKPDDAQVIVVHASNYTDPYNLGEDEVLMVAAHSDACIVELANSGLGHAEGEYIHTLLPGSFVRAGWCDAALSALQDPSVFCVSPKVISTESKQTQFYGLDPSWLPRRNWLSHAQAGDDAAASLCGGFFRSTVLKALSGWFGSGEPSVTREIAEAELALASWALDLDTIAAPESYIYAPKKVIEGKQGGYALGHDAGRLQLAYSYLPEIASKVQSFASRLTYLAGGIVSPKSVAERLGWVVGSSERSLVGGVQWRIERAKLTLASYSESSTSQIYSQQLRRAA